MPSDPSTSTALIAVPIQAVTYSPLGQLPPAIDVSAKNGDGIGNGNGNGKHDVGSNADSQDQSPPGLLVTTTRAWVISAVERRPGWPGLWPANGASTGLYVAGYGAASPPIAIIPSQRVPASVGLTTVPVLRPSISPPAAFVHPVAIVNQIVDVDLRPDQNFLEVTGSLTSDQATRLYHVTIDASTGFLNLDFHSQLQTGLPPGPMPSSVPGNSPGPVAVGSLGSGPFVGPRPVDSPSSMSLELTFFDTTGRQIARMQKGLGDMRMSLSLANVGATGDSSLLVEVSALPTDSSTSPVTLPAPIDFALDISRGQASVTEPTNAGAPTLAFQPTLPATAVSDRLAMALVASAGSAGRALPSGPIIESPVAELDPRPVATGPLPTRGVAPLGGVLGTGDPTPQADGRKDVFVDLDLIGVPEDVLVASAEVRSGQERQDGALRIVPGPGGFPLLSTVVRNDARSARASVQVLPWVRAAQESSDAKREVSSTEVSPKPTRRLSAFAGTSLAIVLVVGLTLPELTDHLNLGPLQSFWNALKRLHRAGLRASRGRRLRIR